VSKTFVVFQILQTLTRDDYLQTKWGNDTQPFISLAPYLLPSLVFSPTVYVIPAFTFLAHAMCMANLSTQLIQMSGISGFKGWKWIFIIEGVGTLMFSASHDLNY
jgi:hypothetical protein